MKLTVTVNQEAIKDFSGGSSFISTEGVFDLIINFASISTTKNGAKQIDFNIDYNGNTQTLYGPTIQNKDETPNTVGMSLVSKLAVIAGLTEGGDLTIEKESHKVGKDNKYMEFDVITDFSGLECKFRIQREYTKHDGTIYRNLRIRNVFAANGASAAEIVDGSEIGKQLAIELEKYVSTPSYRDDVTAEEAEAWEEAQRESRGNPSEAKKAPTTSAVVDKKSKMFK